MKILRKNEANIEAAKKRQADIDEVLALEKKVQVLREDLVEIAHKRELAIEELLILNQQIEKAKSLRSELLETD